MDREKCDVCNADWDFLVDEGYGLPISAETGLVVPNHALGEWAGTPCCCSCYALHQLWSKHVLYYEYMLLDGRLELSFDELIEYGRANAKTSKTVEFAPSS